VWEQLVHTDPVPVLTAAGEDFSEQSTPACAKLQHMKCFHLNWWGCKCNFRGLIWKRRIEERERVFKLAVNLFHASQIPCSYYQRLL